LVGWMPKKVKELSALEVGRLKGDGLHLIEPHWVSRRPVGLSQTAVV
jgi:hypothetical protein